MAKADIKTKKTEASVEDFLNAVTDEKERADCRKIAEIMESATGAQPKMWGASIVGFGERHIKSAAGREVDWMEIGFAPRKANLTLYLSTGEAWNEELLSRLGKHKTGLGCLYIKRLSDVNEEVLEILIKESVENTRRK